MSWFLSALIVTLIASLYTYISSNDRKLWSIPRRALEVSPRRVTEEDVMKLKEQMNEKKDNAKTVESELEKTGRRYIVVGGAGFLGGWIVIQLLQRGENPKNIRVLDIRLPARHDLKYGIGKDVEYMVVDISDREAVMAAFKAEWPTDAVSSLSKSIPLTIFHTAANIRFYERSSELLPKSTRVNVDGTQNIIDAALEFGASSNTLDSTILIYTSSGSVGVRASRFLLWPWENEPENFVQYINDDDDSPAMPKEHSHFFSNYAYSKYLAEQRVRKADKHVSPTTPTSTSKLTRLRTGCIRPGNGVFGPGGDMLCGAYLVRKTNPTWISNIVSHFVYVENCASAHLCYERRLIEVEEQERERERKGTPSPQGRLPDIGGQAFTITDPGRPPTYGDVYFVLEALTNGQTFFPEISPTLMLMLAYVIEAYYLLRHYLKLSILPPVNKDLVNLQPSLFNLTMVHLIFDDSRARLEPEMGGLGYKSRHTTIGGLWKTWDAHGKEIERWEQGKLNRSDNHIRSDGAGVSFGFSWGFGLVRAQRGVGKVVEKVRKVEDKMQEIEEKIEDVVEVALN
ncbi:NAD-P-binding protein [Lentinula detonsa]|uniref:NAD-P-binding protein n=1 Tax=Lentinula detonsa TaxID=2804962 RepID=A0AA38UN13_9AGAR|nr:NAD-P-binding protein [Lentinula detonsa]